MLYQVLIKNNYEFNAEAMLLFLKSLQPASRRQKFNIKNLFRDLPYTYIIDCNNDKKISIYFEQKYHDEISDAFMQSLQTMLGNNAEVFSVDVQLRQLERTSTLFLPDNAKRKGEEQHLASYMNPSIFSTILSSMEKNTRITIDFQIMKGVLAGKKHFFNRTGSDIDVEYELKVHALNKYQNTILNELASKISNITAGETNFFIDYKDSYKENHSSGMELMNVLQIPSMKNESKDSILRKRVYYLLPGQRTLEEHEFSKGFRIGRLYHPIQKDRIVYLDEVQARSQGFISGTTGSGKSAAFDEISMDMIERKLKGEKIPGFTLLDPKETTVLGVIDKILYFRDNGYDITELLKKVVFFDMASDQCVFPISLLNKGISPSAILDFFKSLYGESNTPQVDRTFSDATQCLLKDVKFEHVITDLEKIFNPKDDSYRLSLAARLEGDPYSADQVHFLKTTKMSSDIVNPILNRTSMFKNEPKKKLMFGLPNKYDALANVRKWMDEGYIVLVNMTGMSKFDVQVIGGYFATQYYQTVLKRPPFALLHLLFLEEAHDLQLDVLLKIAAKGREQGLAIFPMTQFAEQFRPDYQKELFGNINTFITMLQSSDAAPTMARRIANEDVTAKDLTLLEEMTGYFTSKDNGSIKSVLFKADPPYRYTDGKVVNHLDQDAMEFNKNKNREFAYELMVRDFISKEEAEKIVFKEFLSEKETTEYEKELLGEGDSLIAVEKGNQIWE